MAAGLPSPGSHFPVLAPGSVRRNMPYFRRERAGPRFGHWFRHFRVCKARHHLVRHGDRINRRRNFDCGFSHVLFIDPLVSVEVGVMGERSIVKRVLRQSDSRQAALLNDVLSVPPVRRLSVATAPMKPQSANGISASRTMSAAPAGPNTLAPLGFPVPESMLKYVSSFAYSGFWFSKLPKCCST